MRNKIVYLNQNMHCYSHYQVQGVYAHLNQKMCQYLDEALAAGCAIRYYDDPLTSGCTISIIYGFTTRTSIRIFQIIPFTGTYTICIFVSNIYSINTLMRNKIVCLNQNMHCYSHYQVQGVYAHLNQNICQDLDGTSCC